MGKNPKNRVFYQKYDLFFNRLAVELRPQCWHARMAIAHKGITPSIIPLSFVEIDQLVTVGGKSFPLMVEDDGTISDYSKTIVERLEVISPELYIISRRGGGTGVL